MSGISESTKNGRFLRAVGKRIPLKQSLEHKR